MINVMLVDDHGIVRQGLKSLIATQSDMQVSAEAGRALACLEILKTQVVDVILMDLQMPGELNGIECTRLLKRNHPECKVIMLTSYHQDEHILPAFEAGALSYLLKDIDPDELLSAIRKAADEQAVLSPQVANKLLSTMNLRQQQVELSEREQQVLKLIASGLNNAEIGEQLFINIKTVRTHVSNILGKLQLRDRTQVAVHAWKSGIMSQEN